MDRSIIYTVGVWIFACFSEPLYKPKLKRKFDFHQFVCRGVDTFLVAIADIQENINIQNLLSNTHIIYFYLKSKFTLEVVTLRKDAVLTQ